jgi:hypothetical protein
LVMSSARRMSKGPASSTGGACHGCTT